MSSRADQNGGDPVVKKRGRNFWVKYFEEKGSERRVLRSDGAKKKKGLEADTKCKGGVDVLNKRVLRSDIAKKTELNGTLLKKDSESEVTYGVRCEKGTVVGVERIEVKNNIGKVRDEDGINAANVAEKVSSGSEQKENTMKVTDESGIDVEDVAGVTYPGHGQNQSSSIIIQQNGAEQIMCEDESEVEERTMMLGVAGQMQANGSDSIEVRDEIERDVMQFVEELDADKKTVTEEVALEGDQSGSGMDTTQLDEEITVGEKCNARSDVADQSEMANIDNIIVIDEAPLEADHSKSSSFISRKNSIGQVTCKEIIRDGNRRVTRSTSAKQREEAEASEKRMSTEVSPRVAVSGNSPNFSERIGVEQIRVADVIKIENPGSVVSRISRQMETAYNKKKKITEVDYNLKHSISNMDYGAGMIKHEEIEVEEKKIRRSDHCKQNSGTKVIEKKVMDSDLKRKRSKGASDNNTISKKIKMETSKGRKDQYDETGKKKVQLNPSKNQGPGAKVAGPVTGQNIGPRQKRMQPNLAKGGRLKDQTRASETLKLLKDDVVLVDAKREASHISHFKSIRGRGGSVRRFSPGKKVGRPAKIQVQWENEENRENSRLASTVGHKGSSISGERKFVKKSSTVVSSGGGQLNREKISSIKKKVSNKAKIKPKISSPLTESKNMYYSNCKEQVTANGEHKTRPLSKQDKEAEILERRMAREKLRNDIKNMLLNAGWKIELRPRKSKDYADVVYISPKGYVYWSITKAYHMLEQQFLGEHDVKDTDLSRKSFKTSRRKTGSSFSPIPMEVLNMLKKTISKRRTNKEIEEDRMKLEDGKKSRRMKKSTCPKSPKNKKFKDKSRKIKKRKKDNDTSCSSVKAVSYTCKKLQTGKFRKKHLGCALLVRGSNQEMASGTDVYVPYVGKRTIFSWMIDMGIMSENARVKYMNDNQPQTLLEGHITRDGIKCSCCSKILPVSKFGIHAGSELCQPYRNIFVEDAGISLLQCQINAWKVQESTCKGFYSVDIHGDDPNDDTCGICGDGGDLICCDGCPSTFHLCCLGIEMLPPGDWHCRNCSCRYCGLISGDSAQGDGGSISPLLSCHQCDEKYHERCARDGDAIPGGSNLSCVPFCGQTCRKLFKQLQMLLGVKNDMDVGFSWTLLQRYDDNLPESDCGLDQKAECNSKIAVALAVMDECFLPIIDQRSGINLIHNVVYNCGSNFSRLNYRSFYTFILERGDEIISVASLRIHGTRVAEMPFIGTRNSYRRQGMCRRLLNEIESALCSLNIEKLIIPAISELMDTWTNVFGFKPLEDLQEIKSVNMLVFPGTGLLQKPLLKNDSARQCESGDEDKPESRHHQRCEAANKLSLCSCIGPEPCTSDCESFRHKPNTKDVDPSFPLSVGCMNSASGVLTEIVDPSFGSEFQASKTPEIVLLTNDLPTDDPWSQHNHQAKCISSEVTANMPSLPHSDGSLVRPYFEGQQTSSAALSFTVEDSAFPRKHVFRASNEQIVDDSSNIGDQVAIIQPKFKALGGNSGSHHSMLVTEPLFAVENKFFTSTKKPNIDALSEDARYSILELKSEFSAPPLKPFANGDADTVCENARHSILELKSESKPSADNGDASKCF